MDAIDDTVVDSVTNSTAPVGEGIKSASAVVLDTIRDAVSERVLKKVVDASVEAVEAGSDDSKEVNASPRLVVERDVVVSD